MRLIPTSCLAGLLLAASACSCQRASSSASTASAASAQVVLERLYLGMSSPSGPVAGEALTAFLAAEVTPRFPDGLTLYRAYGQWRDRKGAVASEPSTVLEIAMPNTSENRRKAAAIAALYCRRFHQEAVLEVVAPISMALLTAESDQPPSARPPGGAGASDMP
jgi:hypothetical protein